ncbi:MAG TPA: universal stress protein [Bryobacteraceae bacterium]|nr:universal stress protein [Bryobacteraceae bacterium]
MPFQSILFPTDFSQDAYDAVPYVRAAVERFGASLRLVHALDVPVSAYASPKGFEGTKWDFRHLREDAERALASFAAEQFPGPRPDTFLQTGDPARAIVETARSTTADLIMMPTHGHGRFRSMLLGSVTAKVLHDAECPVWTSHTKREPASYTARPEWGRMVVAVDLGPESVKLLQFVKEIANATGSTVRLVHAPYSADEPPDELAKMQESAGTNFEVSRGPGTVAKVVGDACVRDRADLLVIGRGGTSALAGRLRTHAYTLVRDAPCPVLSL